MLINVEEKTVIADFGKGFNALRHPCEFRGNMRVKTVYLGLFRNKIGKKEEQFEVTEDTSLDSFLDTLRSKYKEKLSSFSWANLESRVDPTIIVMVNGAAKNLNEEGDDALRDGDIVTLMTIISGG